MNKHRDAFLLLLHNTFLIIFVCEKRNKNSTTFQIFLINKIRLFKEISLCTFSEYYSIMMHSKFNSILREKMAKKMVPNDDF